MEKDKKKAKRLAAGLVTYWIAEAWHELDNDYYKKRLSPSNRKLVQQYIHRYGYVIGLLLRCRYRPH